MVFKSFLFEAKKREKNGVYRTGCFELQENYKIAIDSLSHLSPSRPYTGDGTLRRLVGQVDPQPTVLGQTILTWRPLPSPRALDDAAGRHEPLSCAAPSNGVGDGVDVPQSSSAKSTSPQASMGTPRSSSPSFLAYKMSPSPCTREPTRLDRH